MGRESFELAILVSLRDAASSGADRVSGRLREMGKEGHRAIQVLDDLKKEAAKGIGIAGIGVAGLAALKKGADIAGNFESAMSDLKVALAEAGKGGEVDINKLGDSLNRAEQLTIRLGNKLPGTTQDFVQMVTQLKQGGIDINTILGGAGEAVAYLAVVTDQLPKATAKDFAQFGQQFELQGEEYLRAADLMARVAKSRDLTSDQLIEASKYFQLRAGSALGFKGIEGAEQTIRLMAALKQMGLEGSQAGTGASAFFREIVKKDKLKEIQKEFGLTFQFFDKKGKFAGLENAFKEMEKLRKFSDEKRLPALQKLLGDEGAAVGNIMAKFGLAGFIASNQELMKLLGLTKQTDEKTATYNAKMEALAGTLENLKVTAFTPMLDTLKPLVDKANELTGSIVDFVKAHPELAKTAATMAAVGSATLVVVGSVKALTTAWKIFRLVSAVSSGDLSLLTFLRGVNTEAKTATTSIGGLRGAIKSIPSSVQITVAVIAIEYAIQKLIELYIETGKYKDAIDELNSTNTQAAASYNKLEKTYGEKGLMVPSRVILNEAMGAFSSLNTNDQLKNALTGKNFWENLATNLIPQFSMLDGIDKVFNTKLSDRYNPFSYNRAYENNSVATIRERAPQLANPTIMTEFLAQMKAGRFGLDEASQMRFKAALEKAFPDAVRQAEASLTKFEEGTYSIVKTEADAARAASGLADNLNKASFSALLFAGRAGSNNVGSPSGPAAPFGPTTERAKGLPRIQKNAVGGFVERGGLTIVHANETIVPARVSQPFRERSGGSQPIHIGNVNLNIKPPKGSAMAENPIQFVEAVYPLLVRKIQRERERA